MNSELKSLHSLLDVTDAQSSLELDTVNASGLPAKIYYDPKVFEEECLRLFPSTWVAAGVATDIPSVGDAIPVTVAGRNIILLRDQTGHVSGFYNACRHRGMQLLREPAKGLRRFVCPFHNWGYGLDGRLRGTPFVGGVGINQLEGFDKESLNLKSVRVSEWCNTIFVNIDGKAPPLEQHLAPLINHIGGDRDWNSFYHHKKGSIHQTDNHGNWKEYVEIALEEYHILFAHSQVFDGIDSLTWKDDPVIDGMLLGSEALLSGSYGAGYAYFSGEPLPQWLDRGPRWQSYVLLFPNLGVFATSDQLSIEFMLPTSSEFYDHRQEFYFDGSTDAEGKHKDAIEAIETAWDKLNTQDSELLEGLRNTQRTNQMINNRSRFAGRWEVNIHQFQKIYAESLRYEP